MAIYKCKMCGGQLNSSSEDKIIECDYCGITQTLPKTTDPNIQSLFNRATTLLQKAEYDKAEETYEKIISIDEKEAEAYWGLILCKYGIEYVEDPKTFKRIPTCHRSSYESVIADEDYKKAIFYADTTQKLIYEKEAKTIDEIQKSILQIASKEDPYDIFISYKETDENGKRTSDSVIANDIYYQLTNAGYKVFYSAITLEDKLGHEYEPIIFSALHSSKVMLVIGTKVEYLNAVWVKNEWSRFLKLMKNDRTKLLIPCYKDINPYEFPDEFSHLQAQDMSKIGFINDLIRGIKKVLTKEEKNTIVQTNNNTNNQSIEKLIKRAFIFIEDGQFEEANEYCEKVLDIDVEYGKAYLGKLLAEFKVKNIEELLMHVNYEEIKNNLNLSKVYKYYDSNIVDKIEQNLDKFIIKQKDIVNNKYPNLSEYIKLKRKKKIIFDSSIEKIPQHILLNCDTVESIELSSNVKEIADSAFEGCKNVKSITLPNTKTSLLCIFGKASPINLKEVIILEGCTSIEKKAFSHCESLESITIPTSVTSIESGVFYGCIKLENIIVDENNKYYSSIDGNLYSKDKKTLIQYAKGKEDTIFTIPNSVESIGKGVFRECASLTSITIPNSATSICEWAFSSCTSLTSITIPNSVTSIGERAFSNCTSLTSINVDENNKYYSSIDGNLYTKDKKTLIQYATGKKDTAFTIPNSVESIGKGAFSNCTSLTSITILNNVTSICEWAFSNCTSLTSINVDENNKYYSSIDGNLYTKDKKTLIQYATGKKDTAFTIPNSVESIGKGAFRECTSLTSITILNNVTSICEGAFSSCTSLTSITIKNSVTNINDSAIDNYLNLNNVILPKDIKIEKIYGNSFYRCKDLTLNYEDLEFNLDEIFKNKIEFNIKLAIANYNQMLEKINLIESGDDLKIRYEISEIGCNCWQKIFYDKYFNAYYEIKNNKLEDINGSSIEKLLKCIDDVTNKIVNSNMTVENKINSFIMFSNSIKFIYDTVYKKINNLKKLSTIKLIWTLVLVLISSLVLLLFMGEFVEWYLKCLLFSNLIITPITILKKIGKLKKHSNSVLIDITNLKSLLAFGIERNLDILGGSFELKKTMVKFWSDVINVLENEVDKKTKEANNDFIKKLSDKCEKYNSEIE